MKDYKSFSLLLYNLARKQRFYVLFNISYTSNYLSQVFDYLEKWSLFNIKRAKFFLKTIIFYICLQNLK